MAQKSLKITQKLKNSAQKTKNNAKNLKLAHKRPKITQKRPTGYGKTDPKAPRSLFFCEIKGKSSASEYFLNLKDGDLCLCIGNFAIHNHIVKLVDVYILDVEELSVVKMLVTEG